MELRAHLQERRAAHVREDVVSAGEDQGIGGAAHAIDALASGEQICRTRSEGGCDVSRFHGVGEAAGQEGAPIADGGHVQGGVEERLAEAQAHGIRAAEVAGGQKVGSTAARIKAGVEDNLGSHSGAGKRLQGCPTQAAGTSKAKLAARENVDAPRSQRRAGGRCDLDIAKNVRAAAVGVVGVGENQFTVAHRANLVDRARSGNRSVQFDDAAGAIPGIVDHRVSTRDGGGTSHAQAVAVATGRHRQGVFGQHQIVDLEAVAGVGTKLVDVDGDRAAQVHVDAVGRRVAEDDGAIDAAAVALEQQGAADEVDITGGGVSRAGRSEGNRHAAKDWTAAEGEGIVHLEAALVQGDAAGEGVVAGVGEVRILGTQGEGAGAALDQ